MNSLITLTLTIPAGTPARLPVQVTGSVGVRRVVAGAFRFPSGCAGLAGVRLEHRSKPVAPINGGWVTGDGETVPWSGNWVMDGPPYVLALVGYNIDDTWPHTIEARIEVAQ